MPPDNTTNQAIVYQGVTCRADGCGRRRHYSTGLCKMHHKRLLRNGRLEIDRPVDVRPGEEWRDIPGLEGRHQASSHGRIRWVGPIVGRTYPFKIIRGCKNTDGYYQLRPYALPDKRNARVHQLVALAFLGPCPEGLEVNHVDGDRTNNRPENLEYVSHADNVRHAWALGNVERRGEANGRARLTAEQARLIRQQHAEGRPRTEIAKAYGITAGQVNRIASGVAWSHV